MSHENNLDLYELIRKKTFHINTGVAFISLSNIMCSQVIYLTLYTI